MGIPENNKSGIVLFPNPASGQCSVNLNESQVEVALQVYDVTGKMVLPEIYSSEPALVFDTNPLADGIYFVKLVTDSSFRTQKLVVKHYMLMVVLRGYF